MNKNIVHYAMSTLINFMERQSGLEKSQSPLIGISIVNKGKISGIWATEIDSTAVPWPEIDETLSHCFQDDSILCVVLRKVGPLERENSERDDTDYAGIIYDAARYFLENHGYYIYSYIHDPVSNSSEITSWWVENADLDVESLYTHSVEVQIDYAVIEDMRHQYFFIHSLIEFIFIHGCLPRKNCAELIRQSADYLEVELVRDALCENLFNSYADAYRILLEAIAQEYPGTAHALLSLISYDQGKLSQAEHEALRSFYSFPYQNSFTGIIVKIIFSQISQAQVRNNIEMGSTYAKNRLGI